MSAFFVSPHALNSPLSRPPNTSIALYLSSNTPWLLPLPGTPRLPSLLQPPSTTRSEPPAPVSAKTQQKRPRIATNVDSTDWIASTLTRRFGLGAGLAWTAFLVVGVVSEQIKTRLEVSQQEANTRDVETAEEVVLPNGLRYFELREGGGASPKRGDLVVIELRGKVQGSSEVFVDTFGGGGNKKPLALVMGSRPYSRGMCEGIEKVLWSMKAGGKRRVIVPPDLGFGEKGADFDGGVKVPPHTSLEYVVEVDKVSIAPA